MYTAQTCKIMHTNYTRAYSFFITCTEFHVKFFPKFPALRERLRSLVLAYSTVRSVTKQKNGQPNNLVRFPEEAPDSSLLLSVQTPSGTHPVTFQSAPTTLSKAARRKRGKAHLYPPSRTEVKNGLSHVSSPHSFVACRRTDLPLLLLQ